MPFVSYYLTQQGELRRKLDERELKAALESSQGLLWVDVCETTEEDGHFLAATFGFHRLAVEDCISAQIHPPKIDDFGDHLFIVVHGVNHLGESDIVETAELAIFLGPHYVVSNHNDPLYSVDAVRRLVEEDGRPMRRGSDFLAHALIDALIDNVLPTIDQMSDVADEIEEEVLRNPQQSTLEAVLKLKRSVIRVHRVMAPQREVMNRMSRGEFTLIGDKAQIYYRDIYDHIVRIEDLGQSLRDRADNALATHLSSVANKQNETMRVLSIVATIFLPLALVAGVYGMNFENMPELDVSWAYFAVLGFIGFVIVAVVGFFWARRWVSWGHRQARRVRPFAVDPEKLVGYIGHVRKWPHL
jgi:magnesium transporter